MEFESLVSKRVNDYCDKRFGDKEIELKQVVQMDLVLDPDDPEDEEKKQKILNKMAKDHRKDAELLQSISILIHDSSGNLVPLNGNNIL